jgi:hypothetical protein
VTPRILLGAALLALAGCDDCPGDARCARPGAFSDGFDASFAEDAFSVRADVPLRPRCPDNRACAPACVDLQTDPANCGGCGRACTAGAVCAAGRCACDAPRFSACGAACADLASDPRRCGACERECPAQSLCVAGACRLRAVEPRAGATLGSRRPRFRWGGGAGRVQVCRDAACAEVAATLTGFTGRAAVADPLAPGRYFWRVGDVAAERWEAPWAFRIDRRDTTAQAALPPRPDLDGDGRHDVVVVANGEVHVFGAGLADPTPLWSFPIPGAPGAAARTVSLGDLDGDGRGELLLQAGIAWLARGADRGAAPLQLAAFADGAVAAAGDTDLDGLVELGWAPTAGGVSLSVRRQGVTPADWTGRQEFRSYDFGDAPSLVAPGDVDGDGVGDLVGAVTSTTMLLLVGSAEGFGAPRSFTGGGARATIEPVEAAGDVNGDGLADVLVHRAPAARVLYGGAHPFTTGATLPVTAVGAPRVSPAGDVDGDGFSDLLMLDPSTGEARLIRGGRAGPSPSPVTVRIESLTEAEGPAVALGDVDGDGFDDVAVPSPSRDRVHVLFGGADRPLERVVILQGAAGSRFGSAVE